MPRHHTTRGRVQSQFRAVELAQSNGILADPGEVGPIPYYRARPGAWDTVTIDEEDLPGLCRITGLGIELGRQTVKVRGQDHSTTVTTGLIVPKFTIECWVTSRHRMPGSDTIQRYDKRTGNPVKLRSSMAVWAEFAARFNDFIPSEATNRNYRQVYHPALALCRITSVLIVGVKLTLPTTSDPLIAHIECEPGFQPGIQKRPATHRPQIVNTPPPSVELQPGAPPPSLPDRLGRPSQSVDVG